MASPSSPFPCLKSTGDDKHDMEVYIEDLIDYCVMQNLYDPEKETDGRGRDIAFVSMQIGLRCWRSKNGRIWGWKTCDSRAFAVGFGAACNEHGVYLSSGERVFLKPNLQ